MGVVRRAIALEDARPGRGLTALDRHEVLERDRDAQHGMERLRGPCALAVPQPGVGAVRLLQCALAIDAQPGVQAAVLPLGKIEMRLGQLARRHLARAQTGGHLVRTEAREVRHSPPRMAGTTMNASS